VRFDVETNLHQQLMRCTVCTEVHEIPRRVVRDPEAMLNLLEEGKQDHRECRANPDNLKLAMANRMYRKRMEQELDKASTRRAA